jgi:hypothetical protein
MRAKFSSILLLGHLAVEARALDRAFDGTADGLLVDVGLGQIVERAELDRLGRDLLAALARGHDDGEEGPCFPEPGDAAKAIEAGHMIIHHDGVERPASAGRKRLVHIGRLD